MSCKTHEKLSRKVWPKDEIPNILDACKVKKKTTSFGSLRVLVTYKETIIVFSPINDKTSYEAMLVKDKEFATTFRDLVKSMTISCE